MGQRHQVYAFTTTVDRYGNKKPKRLSMGIYHQWLFGKTAGLQVNRLMKAQALVGKDPTDYHPFNGNIDYQGNNSDMRDCLLAFYRVIPEESYYSSSAYELGDDEKACIRDPRVCDNNDGITVFDFTDPKNPTYCMMNIYGYDKDPDSGSTHLPTLTPVSVEEYVRAYYPVEGTTYQKETYSKKVWGQIQRQVAKIIKNSQGYKVMTPARAKQLFPKMYKEEKKKAKKVLRVDMMIGAGGIQTNVKI